MNLNIETLKNIAIFSELTDIELLEISQMAELIDIKEGETLFKQGDSSDAFYLILEGTLEVLKFTKKRKIQKLVRMSSGAVVGEMAFIAETRRSATIKAVTNTQLIKVKKKPFKISMRECKSIATYKVIHCLSRELALKFREQVDNFQKLYEEKSHNKRKGKGILRSLGRIFSD